LEMSPLKELASSNILSILVAPDTSHSPIGPGALGQSPFGDNFRHSITVRLSSDLDAKTQCTRRA